MTDDKSQTAVEKIRTACPHCGQKMRIKQKYLDKTIPCPTCKKPFKVELLQDDDGGDDEAMSQGLPAPAAEAALPPPAPPAPMAPPAPPPPAPAAQEDEDLFRVLDQSRSAASKGDASADETSEKAMDVSALPPTQELPPRDEYVPSDEPAPDARPAGDEMPDELPPPVVDEAAPAGRPAEETMEEMAPAKPHISQPPALRRGPRQAPEAARVTEDDLGGPMPASTHAAPARRKLAARITPSSHFITLVSSQEAALAEYDFGRTGLLVPERTRALVTDHNIFLKRQRRYLMGLLPGADEWTMQYPIDSPDLARARIYIPSMGRMMGLVVLMLLLGGAMFYGMHEKMHTLPFMVEHREIAVINLLSVASERFNLEDPDTYWWTALPFLLAFIWYGWTFKAWLETDAFKTPVSRWRGRQKDVRACLHALSQVRMGGDLDGGEQA